MKKILFIFLLIVLYLPLLAVSERKVELKTKSQNASPKIKKIVPKPSSGEKQKPQKIEGGKSNCKINFRFERNIT